MHEEELRDLTVLLQAMLHPEPEQRLSIADLRDSQLPSVAWLSSEGYKANSDREIGAEMHERIYASESFR